MRPPLPLRHLCLATLLTGPALGSVAATPEKPGTAAGPAAPATISARERRIVSEAARRLPHALELLERVVNVNSGTMNPEGVREVGRLFATELGALGFATRWVDGAAFARAGHLVAERAGSGPRLLLIGHLDTVFEPASPFQRFERLGEHEARGPGVIDMKGGDVILIEALAALAAAEALAPLSVTVVLTGDEEKPGEPIALARAALRDAAEAADIAIAFENAANDPATAVVSRRGSSRWRLEVSARAAHSSQIFRDEVGAGAIFELGRVLDGFRQALDGERYLSFNPGIVLGGTTLELDAEQSRGTAFGKNNVVAARAVALGDLRAFSREQLERARDRMRAVAAASLPHAVSTIEFAESYPPLAPEPGNLRLLAELDRVSRGLGDGAVTAVDPSRAGAADVSFTAGLVDMALDGLGLMGRDEHTTGETADLRTMPVQIRRTAVLLDRLGGGRAQGPGPGARPAPDAGQ